uniref:Deoxyribonuclease II n=1 Tax=Setaria digitata TaxID=48799 RepID=A0A915PDV9_9BILA
MPIFLLAFMDYSGKNSFEMIGALIIFAIIEFINGQYSCKNRQGRSVDWFVGYKLPKNKFQIYPGSTILYADDESTAWGPTEDLKTPRNAVAVTLKQYYDHKNEDVFYFFYNDQQPGERGEGHGRAHAKGVALFGNSSGFWLLHSVPRFPSAKSYSYPSNGEIYGQSFLCITLHSTSIDMFGKV